MEKKPKVVVTGISGYLGAHVAMNALSTSKYQVRGTVRNKENPAKKKLLSEAFGDKFKDLEVVNADLLNEESIRSALKGIFNFL